MINRHMKTGQIQMDISFTGKTFLPLQERFELSNWAQGTWICTGTSLSQTRDRKAETRRRQDYIRDVYGNLQSWIALPQAPWPALSVGDRHWIDYTVSARLSPTAPGSCGIAFRWVDARHYYLLVLEEQKRLSLYRRQEDELSLLADRAFPHSPGRTYWLEAAVTGEKIECSVDEQILFSLTDGGYPRGGVGLVADAPCEYFSLAVSGIREIPEKVSPPARQIPLEEARIKLPPHESSVKPIARFQSIDNLPHLVLVDNEKHTLSIIDTKGKLVTRLGPWKRKLGCTGDLPFQFFDINGDGHDELVIAADYSIRVYEPFAGTLLAEIPSPACRHYGEDRDNPDPLLAGDTLCPVRLDAAKPHGFYLKDRYWNLYLYDHTLNLRWQKSMRMGHFPLPMDVDGDGREEILCGPCLLSPDGTELWSLPLYDHFDSIGCLSLAPRAGRHLYVMAGEEGLLKIDPCNGKLLAQRKWGHVQTACMGRFVPGRADRQILLNTLWREPGIHILADADCEEIGRWESRYGKCWPLPWGAHDLLLKKTGLLDPMTGDTLFTVPELDGSVTMHVMDWPETGPGRMVVVLPEEMLVYAPKNGFVRHACPLRPYFSNYLPNYFEEY